MKKTSQRESSHPISDIFLNRWSSRAFSDEPVTNNELMTLFEAARFAPSAYNAQPWRFIYTRKGTPLHDQLINLMVPVNQSWAQQAPVLVVLLSKKSFEHNGKPSQWHSFDAGAAWMSLALQATMSGLNVRAIAGFDQKQARSIMHIPEDFDIEIMIAIGKPGEKTTLSPELQAREIPSERKTLGEIVFEDGFNER
ncbi:MAG: Nitroreductase [candidate division TM6 bacterium GW2011_GWE2_41_16]|nr:MAG: Nitroreductase [candidate division TM6 bacterium GW2011_GWE2_41_16]